MKTYQNFILFILLQRSICNKTIKNDTRTHFNKSLEGPKEWTNKTNGIQRRNFGAILEKMKQEAGEAGNYYEPYSEGGEYVFLRTTISPKSWKSKQKYNWTIPTTQPSYTSDYTGNEMGINRDCFRDCPKQYSFDFGRLCGYRYNTQTWRAEFRVFENMCVLEHENCKDQESRPMWMAIHRGQCPELIEFKQFSHSAYQMKKRAEKYQSEVLERTKNHEFMLEFFYSNRA